MSNATNSEKSIPGNFPPTSVMLEMLNVDIFPYFDDYDAATLTFTEKYRAVAVVSQTSRDLTVELNDGQKVDISKIYFEFAHSEKTNVLRRLLGDLGYYS